MGDFELVHQLFEVAAKGGAALAGQVFALPPAAHLVGDAAKALAEVRDLLPPAEVVAARAVDEDDGFSGVAERVVDECSAGHLKRAGHAVLLFSAQAQMLPRERVRD